MRSKNKYFQNILTIILLITVVLSSVQTPATASAQAEQGDGIVRDYNAETGKVTMISGENNEPITVLGAMEAGMTDEQSADMLVQSFAPEFGIANPASDLKIAEQDQPSENRVTTRYQQTYNGVPVIAGELIVNANDQGALSSMNGEVAQDLSLDTNPTITAEEAVEITKQGMVKWYGGAPSDYVHTEVELSIFDEKLLRPSIRPAELVWRIEMISTDPSQPIREFVVVNAKTGNVPLHFNQIDTAWHNTEVSTGINQPPKQDEPTPTPTATEIPVTETPVPTEIIQATPTSQPTDSFQPTPTPVNPPTEEPSDLTAQSGPYYVNIATGNDNNSCTSVVSPCQHIQETINKAASGDTIYVATGTYTKSTNPNPNVLQIGKSIVLSGGWDSTFATQNNVSIIDGANTNNGILVTTGTVTVKNFIIQNSISSNSGAIYIVGGSFTLDSSTLKNNSATNKGAGIYQDGGTLSIINSTISGNGNSSTIYGGGIYANSGTISITNSTIAYNTAKNGGGISRNAGTYTIKNTIVANNAGTTSAPDCSGLLSSVTYSLIENMSGCTITTSSNNLNVDPQISSSLSGPMQIHGILTGSLVIDAGTITGCPSTDQRGAVRPQGASCDMGALEYVVAGPPNSIEVSSGSPQHVLRSSAFGSLLIALVKDSNDFGVSGVTVTFTAPNSGASGTFANTSSYTTTAVTDESGYATASAFTANGTVGNYVVEASVSGVGTVAQFSLENYSATPTTISVSSGSGQSVYTNAAYSNPLRVLVLDQYSTPIQGVTVTFTAPSSGASAVFSNTGNNVTTAITNASGIALSASFSANGTAGTYAVQASATGVVSPANFSLTSVPAPAPQYVAPNGADSSSCSNPASPCLTIDYAISKASTNSIIYVARGTYTSSQSRVVSITKSLTLSGGWNSSFTTQSGFSTIDGQLARGGIQVNASGATVFITNFMIQNGSATQGGGIYNSNANLTVSNSTIKNNFAGGIYSSSALTLNNVTVSNNSAGTAGSGGGIYKPGSGDLTILNSTIANNKATYSGAGFYEWTGGTVTVRNSIIANNTGGTDCYGTINVSQNNLFGSLDGCTRTSSSGDLVNVDPMIPLVTSGSLLALRTGSPAIDAGNAATCLGTDERGLARPEGGVCDIGAYERPSLVGPVATLTVLAGSGQQSEVLFTFPTTFSVLATDADGDPVQSQAITFTAPSSGASGTFANTSNNVMTATTDVDGIASASAYTANNSAGNYTLQVTANAATPANFQLQNFIRVPTTVVVQSGSDQAAAAGLPFSWPLVALVRDQFSVPMTGITVTFTAPASGSSGVFTGTGTNVSTAVTNSSGLATAPTLTANTTTGTFQINATVVGVASPAAYQLTIGNGRFVSAAGTDLSTCTISASPCRTIQYALGQAQSGNPIYVGEGVYTSTDPTQVVNITKNIILSGGWNSTFTSQPGYSTIDGQDIRRGITVGNYVVFIGGFEIINGYSSVNAGGIDTVGTLTLENVTLTNNQALNVGGGIHNIGVLIINNSILAANQAPEGGAIHTTVTATLNNVTLSENQATRGGAIENTGTLTLNNVTLSDNQAVELGGAIYQRSNALHIANSTLSQNYAGQQGGGIYIIDGSVSINNSTIYQNYVTNLGTAAIGGGIANENERPLFIKNTIIAGNAGEYIPDCLGPVTSEGHNLIGYAAGCDVTASAGDLIGFNDPINAMLGDLADNGGSTQTHALLTGSPAIDAGDPLTCKTGDQRGVARPQGSACDIGAFEGSSAGSSSAIVRTYTAVNQPTFPGTFLCAASTPLCTNGANPHADAAHQYALGVYDFYLNNFGRHSIDNNNMPIISTVHYKPSFDNAQWTGAQMIYGDVQGFPLADDVVAHELTHGVTDYESQLYYYYQSGAINESLSDIFGEFYDQTNGLGTDTPAVKWLFAEDVQPGGTGAFRSMKNPPAFNDPDKMTSPYYDTTYIDKGGVHSNSGVNNKAAYLMVDGDTFNGIAVTGIGWEKTTAIYYEVQTHLLFSGADYSDLYYALQQACTTLSLTNVEGITSQDCVQVKNALDAVEMNSSPTPEYNPDPAACPAGTYTTPALTVFEDDFENGTGNWKMTENWSLTDFYAADPTHSMWADDYETFTRSDLTTKNGYLIPPGNTYLYFKHAFDFDYNGDHYYDGGLLEVSIDNGSTWGNAKQLYSAGKNYGGMLMPGFGNPLSLQYAFVGESHGYVASQFNLGSLAGNTIKLRWSMGTDDWENSYLGWHIDDVRIYRCTGEPMMPVNAIPANNSLVTDLTPTLSWETLPYDGYLHVQVATEDTFASPIYDVNNVLGTQWTIPANLSPETTYYWRVRSYNWFDETDDWSTSTSFRTTVSPPALFYPAYNQYVLNNRLLFDWSNVPNALSYRIEVWNSHGSYADTVVTDSQYQMATDLPANSRIQWRVFVNGVDGPSAPSESSFYTACPPSVPILVAPPNNILKTTPTLKLDWDASVPFAGTGTTVSNYELQVAADQAFSSVLFTQNNIVPTDFTLSASLPANSNIYWRVRTYNNRGEYTNWSTARSFRTLYPAPTLTTIPSPLTNNRPLFDWNDITGTTSYTLQVSTVNTFASLALSKVVNGSVYTPIADLPANKTLYWRVNALGSNGPSAWSAVSSFSTANPPSVPTLALPADKSLSTDYTPRLDWGNSTVPLLTSFDRYHLQIAADTAFTAMVDEQNISGVSNSEYTPTTDLPANTTYYWRVRSLNTNGHASAWSLVRSFRTSLVIPQPALPANGTSLLSNRPTFDWDDVAGATSYTVQVSTVNTFSSFVFKATANTSSYMHTADLPTSKTLYWRVIANGVNGPSLPSGYFSLATANAPSIPTLAAPAENLLITNTIPPKLDWNNATAPAGTTFAHYQLQVATDASFSSMVLDQNVSGISNSEFTLSPLSQNTKYYWRVRSHNSLGQISTWSLVRSFRIALPATALALPAAGATLQPNRPTFDWDDVAGVTGYTVQISLVNTFATILVKENTTGSIYTPIKDLPANKVLYWRVIANGVNGPSLPSAYFGFTTANPPSVPVLVTPAENLLITNTFPPKLDWGSATVPAGVTLGGYQLQVATDANFSSMVLDQDMAASEFTLSPLSQNTKYYWRVRSHDNANHFSSWSLVRSFRMVMPSPSLIAPTGTQLTNRPTFDWNVVSGATSYTVQVSTVNTFASFVLNTSAAGPAFTPAVNLPVSKTLYWRVIANGLNSPSAPSAALSFITANPPSVPTLSAPAENLLIANTLTPKLDWNNVTAPTGTTFDHYQLQVATEAVFSSIILDQNVSGISNSEFTLSSPLSHNTKYYWRVRAYNSLGQYSGWSLVRSFRMVVDVPVLASPMGSLPLTDLTPIFDWDDVAGAAYYSIQISTTNTFTTTLVNTTASSSTFTPTVNLPAHTALYWRILVQGANGPGSWSAPASFIIQ